MAIYILTFLISLIISFITTLFMIKLSEKYNIFDKTDFRKIHSKPMSRIGGLGIFLAFTLSFFIIFKRFKADLNFNIYFYITALSLSFILGFLDDIIYIRARYKLLAQVIIAFIASLSGLLISHFIFFNVFIVKFGYFSYIITIIWIVLFMNAINLIDGMDGLASGIVALASISIFIISLIMKNLLVSYISLILLGSIIGFYIFNFPPAKIFMGDGGSYFLGFMYSTIGLMGIKKSSVAVLFAIPIVLLSIPIVDIVRVIIKRIKEKKGLFIADKTHIHHRLLSMGLTTKNILFIVYFITMILGVFSVLVVLLPKEYAFIIFILIFLIMFFCFYLIYMFEKQIVKMKKENIKK